MYDNDDTWEEWTQQLLIVSGWEIDHTCTSEETAARNYPNLYAYYEQGEDPEQYICDNRIVYKDEGDYIEIWRDPDEPDDYDEELEAILSNTEFYQTFSSEISNLKVLNNIVDINQNALNTLKKQIFVSAITCLETYLSDAFINTVLSDKEYIKSFFSSYQDFKNHNITMNTLFTTVEKAEEIAKGKMSEILYHNISKVSKIYNATLNISFPEIKVISKYVSQRHDLVHRNGKDKKGKQLIVDKKTIDKLLDEVVDFVNKIDEKLNYKETTKQSKKNEDDWDSIPF